MNYDPRRVVEAFFRLWDTFRGRRPPVDMKTEHDADRTVPRGRFWTEFRAGQREAEAHSSRLP